MPCTGVAFSLRTNGWNLSSVVNITNILRAAYFPTSLCQKINPKTALNILVMLILYWCQLNLWSISSTFYMRVLWKKVLSYFCQSQNVTSEKLRKALSYEKGVRKMSMKLTPTCHLIFWEYRPWHSSSPLGDISVHPFALTIFGIPVINRVGKVSNI